MYSVLCVIISQIEWSQKVQSEISTCTAMILNDHIRSNPCNYRGYYHTL